MAPSSDNHHNALKPTTTPTAPPVTSTTHHHPKKKFFNRLQALITSPKRVIGHARDADHHIHHHHGSRSRGHSDSSSTSAHSLPVRDRATSVGSSLSASSGSPVIAGAGVAASPTSSHGKRDGPSHVTSPMTSQESSPTKLGHGKKEEQLLRLESPIVTEQAAIQAENRTEGAVAQEAAIQEQTQQPEVLVRPHLKLRLVTWNMHDSLPTGDLTELLGFPTTTTSSSSQHPTPLDPTYPIPPLASGLTKDPPYHLIVVGGQEVPVGYGGWSGPNWTEIIQGWLNGTSLGAKEASAAAAEAEASTHRVVGSPLSQQYAFEGIKMPEEAVSLSGEKDEEEVATPNAGATEKEDKEILSPSAISGTPLEAERTPLSPAAVKRVSAPAFLFPPTSAQAMERSHSTSSSRTAESVGSVTGGSQASMSSSSNSSTATTTGTAPGLPGAGARQGHSTTNPNAPSGHMDATAPEAETPYILVAKERLMGIYCSIWAHRSVHSQIHGSSTGTVTAGLLAGKLGNKGAACISLWIADTRVLFVCAHLAAHSERMNVRQQNVKKIKEELVIETFREAQKQAKEEAKNNLKKENGTTVPTAAAAATYSRKKEDKEMKEMKHEEEALAKEKEKELAKENREKNRERLIEERNKRRDDGKGEDITDCFDYTFWFGDLNFRLDISRLHADFLIKEKQYTNALSFDQLTPILKEPDGCFRGFTEAPINFAPTFKYDVLKLKRSKTLQRSGTAMSITSSSHERRRSMKRMSAPASGLGGLSSPSRSTLPNDGLTEAEEEDEDDEEDRHTLASSRASISSAFSGFETVFDDDGNPIDRPMGGGLTPGGGYFGGGGPLSPGTPTAEKLVEKAKGFFNMIKPKHHHHSHSFQSQSSSSRPHSRNGDPMSPGLGAGPKPPPSPLSINTELRTPQSAELTPTMQDNRGGLLSPSISSANGSALSLSESAPPNSLGMELHHLQQQKVAEATAAGGGAPLGRKSLSIDPHYGNHHLLRPATPVSINVSPATSPRPRLHSSRSSATIFSFASGGAGIAAPAKQVLSQEEREKQVEDDSVFDSSSKKRVQSWTDRVLYKSTIKPTHNEAEGETVGRHGVGSTIIDSLKGMKRTLTGHHLLPGSGGLLSSAAAVPVLQQRRTGQRVSFQQQQQQQQEASLSHTASAPPLYSRKNTSSSSVHSQTPGSQQRLNNRFAKLFHRHSSNNANLISSPPTQSPELPATPESGEGQSLQPPKLLRSMSLQHRLQRRNSGKRPGSAGAGGVTSSSIGEKEESVSPGKLRTTPRAKPRRSYTSPDSVQPLEAGTGPGEGVEHPPKLSILPLAAFEKDEKMSPPLATGGTGTSTATSATLRPSSTAATAQNGNALRPISSNTSGRSRAMSDTSLSSTPPNFSSGLDQAASIQMYPVKDKAPAALSATIELASEPVPLDESKRSFSFSNPFAGFQSNGNSSNSSAVGPSASAIPAGSPSHAATMNERSVKASQNTGLGLPLSKTTPIPASSFTTSVPAETAVLSSSAAAATTSPSALRQWWNTHHLFLPSFLSHNVDDPLATAVAADLLLSQDPLSTQNGDDTALLPPAPVIVGPERGEVMCITYDAIADLRRMQACSDHRPVVAVYALGL